MGKLPETTKTGFVHSAPVPQLYKSACRILEAYDQKKGSLKMLIYQQRSIRLRPKLQGLVSKILDNRAVLMKAIDSSNIFIKEPRFNEYMALVLAGELLHKEAVEGNSKPVLAFQKYQNQILNELKNSSTEIKLHEDKERIPRYVRVNTLVKDESSLGMELKRLGFSRLNFDSKVSSYDDFLNYATNLGEADYMEDYHIPDVLLFAPDTKFYDQPLYKDQAIILQDKASCLPVSVSNVYEGCSVIDACAAPGNKTSHMAAKMKNKGKIVAFERSPGRFATLKEFLRARSVTCAKSYRMNFLDVNPFDYPDVEYIFVDPSCSASGTNYHNDEVGEDRLQNLSMAQAALVSHALSFPAVKEVIYSTCSVISKENEEVVDSVLSHFEKKFELADLSQHVRGWKHFGLDGYKCSSKCLRTSMSEDACVGFFVAKFVRRADLVEVSPKKDLKMNGHPQKISKKRKQSMGDDASEAGKANGVDPTKKKFKGVQTENVEDEIVQPSGAVGEVSKEKEAKLQNGQETQSNIVSVVAEKIKKKKKVNSQDEQKLEEPMAVVDTPKKKKKNKENSQDEQNLEEPMAVVDTPNNKKKKKKKKNKENSQDEQNLEEPMAVVDTPDKKKKKNKENSQDEQNLEEPMAVVDTPNKKKKKKKKKKNKENSQDEQNLEEPMAVDTSKKTKNKVESQDEQKSQEPMAVDVTSVKKSKKKKKNKDTFNSQDE